MLDQHVLSSWPIESCGEVIGFETTRSLLGELVYRLKYRDGPPDAIVETAVAFIRERWRGALDCVVAAPPSVRRTRQPVGVVADRIGKALGIPMLLHAVVKTTVTQPMKSVRPPERPSILGAAIQPGPNSVQDMRVLLVDDVFETGSTLRRTAEVLADSGASEIRALALTRTK